MEAARTEEPAPGYLEAVRDLAHAQFRELQAFAQFIEQAVEPLLKGKRLMPLAQAQQTKRLLANAREELLQPTEQALKKPPRITVTRAKAQPQALPLLRQVLAELDGVVQDRAGNHPA